MLRNTITTRVPLVRRHVLVMDRRTDRAGPATRPRRLTTVAIMQPLTATGIRTLITTALQSSLGLEDAGATDAAGK